MSKFYTKQADKLKYLNNNFRDRNLLNLKKKNKFLTKVIDGLIMYYTLYINIPLHKVLCMGHYLTVAHTTHLPRVNFF